MTASYTTGHARVHGHFLKMSAIREIGLGPKDLVEIEARLVRMRKCFVRHDVDRYRVRIQRNGQRLVVVFVASKNALLTVWKR